ncbi:MAG: HEPN domain-containing protein [Coriobacteriia bacterium]|nr:HEPN domain-containing protein [Coriobacteriia bacterium]
MSEFEKCLKRGALKSFKTAGPDIVLAELRSAREDLADAEFLAANDMPKRTTITAYYAMFHAARAAVLAKGYAEKSHYCLLVAFRELYASDGEGLELARGIERARVLRENADYLAEFSTEAAEATLIVARRFVGYVEGRLANPGC